MAQEIPFQSILAKRWVQQQLTERNKTKEQILIEFEDAFGPVSAIKWLREKNNTSALYGFINQVALEHKKHPHQPFIPNNNDWTNVLSAKAKQLWNSTQLSPPEIAEEKTRCEQHDTERHENAEQSHSENAQQTEKIRHLLYHG